MLRLATVVSSTLLLVACASPTQPTPTIGPSATTGPTPTAQASKTGGPDPTLTPTAAGSTAPPSPTLGTVVFEPFAEGFASPIFVTHAGDGSGLLYVVEQAGVIRVLDADGTAHDQPYLDIIDRVASGGERGLLGLAFHPDYAQNGRFFVNYTDKGGDTIVAEYSRSSAGTGDPNSERVLFTVDQPFANHNGGMVAFGPDGALYIGMGDGGSGGDPQGNGQNPAALLGKMLRFDVDAAGSTPEIWDSGLRNPWRFSFDSQTGDLFIGDVGQGQWEEIDAEPAGAGGRNYGWNIMEGPDCFLTAGCDQTGLTAPVASYPHSGSDCSVSGGYVYRGQAVPALVGTYVFGDYCSGIVRGLDAAAAIAGGEVEARNLAETGFNISSFGVDEAGELYVVYHGGQIARVMAGPASLP
jgi:glucose/arabinose dehydrogenase